MRVQAHIAPDWIRRGFPTDFPVVGSRPGAQPAALSRSITEAVYNRYAYDKEKRKALTAWEGEVRRLSATPARTLTNVN